MDLSDSESSDGGDSQYTTTNVLLGFASVEPTEDAISQLGGQPDWLDAVRPASAALARCSVCSAFLVQLLQLHANLPERFPHHERRLHVLACRKPACRRKAGSVKVLRGVKVLQDAPKPKTRKSTQTSHASAPAAKVNLGNAIFGPVNSAGSSTGSNPFSSPSSPAANQTAGASGSSRPPARDGGGSTAPNQQETDALTASFAQKATVTPVSPPESHPDPWPTDITFPPPFRKLHLDAEYETLDAPSTSELSAGHSGRGLENEINGTTAPEVEGSDVFESTIDKTFQRFADRLAQNPQQVLRYEFGGQPLLYSRTDAVGTLLAPEDKAGNATTTNGPTASGNRLQYPPCPRCRKPRTFELQMTPYAIAELEEDSLDNDGMDWGTIIVAVCQNDCVAAGLDVGSVTYVEEWAGVQWEEVRR